MSFSSVEILQICKCSCRK